MNEYAGTMHNYSCIQLRGGKNMKKWRCKVCGYEVIADEPPAVCPVCGVPADEFEEVPMDE